MTLRVAPDLTFPEEYAVYKAAILATSGAGKSNTAVVLAEAMYHAGIPWVAVDPKGDWWGMRIAADGEGPGLPIPILGGLHGDVPLDATNGKIVARMLAERRLTCILDVSEFDSLQEMWRFLADFASELLRQNRYPLHVFAEEAADYLPQTKSESGWLPKCVNAWRRLVSHGRNHGIGITLLSQRSAKIDKEALDLVETLIAMRATSPRDLNAIRGWVASHDIAAELVDSLPTLADGEGWVWSPHRMKVWDRVQFSRRSTFDSGSTPLIAADAAERQAVNVADVDLAVLKDELAATIEKHEADDPERLRAEITRLKRELAQKPPAEVSTVYETIEIVPPDIREAATGFVPEFDEMIRRVNDIMAAGADTVREFAEKIESVAGDTRRSGTEQRQAARRGEPPRGAAAPPPTPTVAPSGDYTPRAGARRMLEALARYPDGLTAAQVATHAKVKRRGGTFGTYASELSRAGAVVIDGGVQGGTYRITEFGMALVGGVPLPTDPAALRAEWRDRLGAAGARRMFDRLVDRYPAFVSRAALADWAGIAIGGGTFGTYLSRMRSNGLIEESDEGVRAHPDLFMEPR